MSDALLDERASTSARAAGDSRRASPLRRHRRGGRDHRRLRSSRYQVGLLNGRIDQLAAKVNGTDEAFGVKFDETNAKLDAVSERLGVQLKTMKAEIAAIVKGSAAASSLAPPGSGTRTTGIYPGTAGTCAHTKAHATAEGPAVTYSTPRADARRRRRGRRACRWCRPMWGLLAIPALWLFPLGWRTFWQYATRRHVTSFWVSRPPGASVNRGVFGPRRRRKARHMDCNSARRLSGEHCGPQARHFAARLPGLAVAGRIDHRRLPVRRRLFLAADVPSRPCFPGPGRCWRRRPRPPPLAAGPPASHPALSPRAAPR